MPFSSELPLMGNVRDAHRREHHESGPDAVRYAGFTLVNARAKPRMRTIRSPLT